MRETGGMSSKRFGNVCRQLIIGKRRLSDRESDWDIATGCADVVQGFFTLLVSFFAGFDVVEVEAGLSAEMSGPAKPADVIFLNIETRLVTRFKKNSIPVLWYAVGLSSSPKLPFKSFVDVFQTPQENVGSTRLPSKTNIDTDPPLPAGSFKSG
jgi:hypothetical protein